MDAELDKYAWPLRTKEQQELFEEAWQRHYDSLYAILMRYGKEWTGGKGDFLLVDTAYQCRLQKVEIMDVSFITPELVRDTQTCLRDLTSNWGVMFSLWLRGADSLVNLGGFIVCADHVEDHWDHEGLTASYGDRLKWLENWCKNRGGR